jgi:hypothetical protein
MIIKESGQDLTPYILMAKSIRDSRQWHAPDGMLALARQGSRIRAAMSWPKKYIRSTISHSESMTPLGRFPREQKAGNGWNR